MELLGSLVVGITLAVFIDLIYHKLREMYADKASKSREIK